LSIETPGKPENWHGPASGAHGNKPVGVTFAGRLIDGYGIGIEMEIPEELVMKLGLRG